MSLIGHLLSLRGYRFIDLKRVMFEDARIKWLDNIKYVLNRYDRQR